MTTAPNKRPGKVRRVDFYPDEFLSGVDKLSPEEIGLYWPVCAKIYSRSAGLPDDDAENARIFHMDVRMWRRLKGAVIAKGKLRIENGTIINDRCMSELARARKRIDDAAIAGAQGGRPPQDPDHVGTDPPDFQPTSPELREEVGEKSARSVGEVPDISPHELNGNNDITKATGFSAGNPTNNHQPTNLPKKDMPPNGNDQKYGFEGIVIHLTQADLSKWKTTYYGVPDLLAELSSYDAWFAENVTDPKERGRWYHRTRQRMNKLHQDRLAQNHRPAKVAAI